MLELWPLHSAHRLMLIDIYMKFHKDSLNGFQVKEQTRFCDRRTDEQMPGEGGRHNLKQRDLCPKGAGQTVYKTV